MALGLTKLIELHEFKKQLHALEQSNGMIQQNYDIGSTEWHFFETIDDQIFDRLSSVEAEIEKFAELEEL